MPKVQMKGYRNCKDKKDVHPSNFVIRGWTCSGLRGRYQGKGKLYVVKTHTRTVGAVRRGFKLKRKQNPALSVKNPRKGDGVAPWGMTKY